MNDKYDDAGILIRPIVKLESEMNQPENEQLRKCAELEALHNMESASLPSESFELAQLRVRVGEMAAEIERLQSEIDAANAQEHIATIGDTWGLFWRGADSIADIAAKHGLRIGDKLYARPIPAHQSGKLLGYIHTSEIDNNGSRSVLLSDKPDEFGISVPVYADCAQQSPAVAVPDWYVVDRTDCDPKVFKTKDDALHFALASKSLIVAKETKVYPVFIGSQSPRITEQDAIDIIEHYIYWKNYDAVRDSSPQQWCKEETGSALLAKLNKPDSVGGG